LSNEKQKYPLLPPTERKRPHALILAGFAFVGIVFATHRFVYPSSCYGRHSARFHGQHSWSSNEQHSCPQADVLAPKAEIWAALNESIATAEFQSRAIEWLAGAVRIPTESYDRMDPVGVDPRWEAFAPFHEYLATSFPLVHSTLSLNKVNTWGLLYEWTGSDASLKPVLMAAHQDVVPVHPGTVNEWTHPPYSGHFDGKRIWGRGSADDKSGLIGILSAIEILLEKGFKPARTIVLAFGFDEEAGGRYGATELAVALLETYGENAFAFIMDEGAPGGIVKQYGRTFALPGIAEKGAMNTHIEISSPGGHSSVPPKHTSIGMLARMLVEFENNPYEVKLTHDTIIYGTLQCYAKYAPDVPKKLRKAIIRSQHSKRAMREVEKTVFQDPILKSLAGTTQAIDLISGGVKSNALPESATAVVNHRVSSLSSIADVKAHDTALLKSLASKFNLTYTAFGNEITTDPGYGKLDLKTYNAELEPAPVTPITGEEANPWRLLTGTIKATYNSRRGFDLEEDKITVAPGMPSGNTDTSHYWKLAEHIFRYGHLDLGETNKMHFGAHTVNEYLEADSLVEVVLFFVTLILNVDETTTL
ncbi:hypothetical protein C8J56DRAFT_921402, partial [Mycena floridula]